MFIMIEMKQEKDGRSSMREFAQVQVSESVLYPEDIFCSEKRNN